MSLFLCLLVAVHLVCLKLIILWVAFLPSSLQDNFHITLHITTTISNEFHSLIDFCLCLCVCVLCS